MATGTTTTSIDQVPKLVSRTGRIKLVKATAENDAAVAALWSHPEVRRYLPHFPKNWSVEYARSFRESRDVREDYHEYHVLRCSGDGGGFDRGGQKQEQEGKTEFIGETMAFHIDTTHKSCEAGIVLVPEVHRTGVATDVLYTLFSYIFEVLELHRVCMRTDSENVGMRGWLEKVAGARLEVEEKDTWRDPVSGVYTDVVGYGILDWEWKDRVKDVLERRLGL
ncbi:hypothetical protein GYMLUDRAFT_912779 [Collybiopsis luxurians FD-317 M1]|nr:hypothetical protein GYMLUDRAFT_912779 [Collybiopsis luxurians FD-317 M1]